MAVEPTAAAVVSIAMIVSPVVPEPCSTPPLLTALAESMVIIGIVSDLNAMPAPELIVRSPSTLVLWDLVSAVLIVVGPTAMAGLDSSATAAAESMRVRLFKSNLL